MDDASNSARSGETEAHRRAEAARFVLGASAGLFRLRDGSEPAAMPISRRCRSLSAHSLTNRMHRDFRMQTGAAGSAPRQLLRRCQRARRLETVQRRRRGPRKASARSLPDPAHRRFALSRIRFPRFWRDRPSQLHAGLARTERAAESLTRWNEIREAGALSLREPVFSRLA